MNARKIFWIVSVVYVAHVLVAGYFNPWLYLAILPFIPFFYMGVSDILQTRHSILKNFPVIGHFRYWFEMIRPEIQQYFVEDDENGRPFSREQRSVIYQRAKGERDSVPFGTKLDHYKAGHEWINHSIAATHAAKEDPRVLIGNEQCKKPYSASIFNISAMSFGALSNNAIRALSMGAKKGNFYHNTGEGGLSPYHIEGGGDLVWQIGTGYFGCRDQNGNFDSNLFKENASRDQVKMIEIKLSQGAKPGHGGILPASKLTPEIAKIRNVPLGKDVLSPPAHTAFSTPVGLLEFVAKLRELSGGKPVGFKLCLGEKSEFFAICKAMLEKKIYPDFITIDGSEGGTGAAPLEFTNHLGTPLEDALVFVHNTLITTNLRSKIKIITSGRLIQGFDIVKKIALGADLCNSARGMMFSLGCIQALRCNSNECPAGVATQNPHLVKGLEPIQKSERVYRYHHATVESFKEVIAAAGLKTPDEITPGHIQRRMPNGEVKSYQEVYPMWPLFAVEKGLLAPAEQQAWDKARPDRF